MRKISLAIIISALLMSGCSAHGKTPLGSSDIPTVTMPAGTGETVPDTTFGALEDETTTQSETVPAESEASDTEVSVGEMSETGSLDVSSADTEPGDTYTIESLNTTLYASDTLNVRDGPSTDDKIVGQLNPGDEVNAIGLTSNGWYQIMFYGSPEFAYAEYLTEEKPEIEKEELTIPENYYFSNDSDYYFLVNKDNLLPDDYEIETSVVQGSYELEIVAAYHCREMIEAAKADGISLKVLSAYRTIEYQRNLFDKNVDQRMNEMGMTYDEAVYDVSVNIAPPGGSEHNAGLAVDIIDVNHWDTYEDFENTPEFKWLSEHCTEYGFVLRYPKGKEDLTGYIYEPWHYRYVGLENAKAVMTSGLCLEELLET